MLQSAVSLSSSGVAADTATNTAGGVLTLNGSTGQLSITIANSALGVSNVALTADPSDDTMYSASLSGGRTIDVYVDSAAAGGELSWTRYGSWAIRSSGDALTNGAHFVGGYETPSANVPTSGTATYSGAVSGTVVYASTGGAVQSAELTGSASLQANFAAGNVTGSLTNMSAGTQPWNDVSLSATLGSNRSTFSGTTAAASAPGGQASLSGSAEGTVSGQFYGPTAQEAGAVWTLSDGAKAAIGTIGAKKD